METKMNSAVLARKLKARIQVLKRQRTLDLKAYDKAFAVWKVSVARWLKTEPQKRIPKVRKADVERGNYYSRNLHLPDHVFEGVPKPPSPPSDKCIREIQKTLRYLAFTDVTSVQVDVRKLDEWLGTKGLDCEEENDS